MSYSFCGCTLYITGTVAERVWTKYSLLHNASGLESKPDQWGRRTFHPSRAIFTREIQYSVGTWERAELGSTNKEEREGVDGLSRRIEMKCSRCVVPRNTSCVKKHRFSTVTDSRCLRDGLCVWECEMCWFSQRSIDRASFVMANRRAGYFSSLLSNRRRPHWTVTYPDTRTFASTYALLQQYLASVSDTLVTDHIINDSFTLILRLGHRNTAVLLVSARFADCNGYH